MTASNPVVTNDPFQALANFPFPEELTSAVSTFSEALATATQHREALKQRLKDAVTTALSTAAAESNEDQAKLLTTFFDQQDLDRDRTAESVALIAESNELGRVVSKMLPEIDYTPDVYTARRAMDTQVRAFLQSDAGNRFRQLAESAFDAHERITSQVRIIPNDKLVAKFAGGVAVPAAPDAFYQLTNEAILDDFVN